MSKQVYLPSDPKFLADVPWHVALVSTIDQNGIADICPVAAWGLINGFPRLYYVSIAQRDIHTAPPLSSLSSGFPILPPTPAPAEKPNEVFWRRHTALDLESTKELVLNIPHSRLKDQWLKASTHSRNWEADIFALSKFTKEKAKVVKAPLIAECPINIECKVVSQLSFPTHDLFILEPLVCHSLIGVITESGVVGLEYSGAATLVCK
jgi:flavin reductase (DIM6/NTAB) family NADH-FMN oxidoreductase RutF